MLQVGSSGVDVIDVQTALNNNGARLAVDGKFGTLTKQAVMAYQTLNGLAASGVVDTATAAQLGLVLASSPSKAPAWDGSVVFGLDLSSYQKTMGPRDWAAAWARGFRWMYAKANDGMSGPQSTLVTFKRDAIAAGFIVSAGYCFSRYNTNPVAQADAFVNATGGVKSGELPHVLDVEWDNSSADKAKYGDGKEMDEACEEHTFSCLTEIERLSGVTPWLYTSAGFFKARNPGRFLRFPAIIANYSTKADDKILLQPGLREVARQYSGTLSVGQVSEIDGDRFLGTYDQLKAYRKA